MVKRYEAYLVFILYFEGKMINKTDKGLVGNEKIEEAICDLKNNFTDENLAVVLSIIRKRMQDKGQFVVGVDASEASMTNLSLKTVNYNGAKWFIAFTSFEEELKRKSGVMSGFLADIDQIFDITLKSENIEGLILNPHGNMLTINKAIIEVII